MAPIIEELDRVLSAPSVQQGMLKIAMSEIGAHALVWVAALGAGTIWGFTVLHPDPLRLVAATAYCVTVLAPVLMRDARG